MLEDGCLEGDLIVDAPAPCGCLQTPPPLKEPLCTAVDARGAVGATDDEPAAVQLHAVLEDEEGQGRGRQRATVECRNGNTSTVLV